MRRSNRRLAFEPLEVRDVPAGTVTATLIAGVLTLNGDDFGNEVTITVGASTVTLTPDPTTTIDSLGDPAPPAAGTPVVLPGTAVAITAFLRDGGDVVRSHATAAFRVPGLVFVDLGDGNNTLNLDTTGRLTVGGLTVRAADGFDAVVVRGGSVPDDSTIFQAGFAYGDGGSDTEINNVQFPGPVGTAATLTAGDGNDTLRLINTTMVPPGLGFPRLVSVAGGVGELTVSASSFIGSLSATGSEVRVDMFQSNPGPVTIVGGAVAAADLEVGAVNGNLTVQALRRDGDASLIVRQFFDVPNGSVLVRSGGSATLTVPAVTDFFVTRDLTVAAGTEDATVVVDGGDLVARNLTVSSAGGNARYEQTETTTIRGLRTGQNVVLSAYKDAEFDQDGGRAIVTGGMTLTGQTAARLTHVGASATTTVAGPVRVAGLAAEAVLDVGGTSWTGSGTTTVTSPGRAQLLLTAGTTGRLEGHVAVQGGSGFDEVTASATAEFVRNLTVTLGAGGGRVQLLPGSRVGGALTVTGGTGADDVTLRGVDVTGATRVVTGGGTDILSVNFGATFDGTFFADLGGGADTINIAQDLGAPGPVTFTGKATILGGTGGDTLRLGQTGADPNRRAVFGTAGSAIDGGAGVNLFDDEQAVFSGPVSIVRWTDPTP